MADYCHFQHWCQALPCKFYFTLHIHHTVLPKPQSIVVIQVNRLYLCISTNYKLMQNVYTIDTNGILPVSSSPRTLPQPSFGEKLPLPQQHLPSPTAQRYNHNHATAAQSMLKL